MLRARTAQLRPHLSVFRLPRSPVSLHRSLRARLTRAAITGAAAALIAAVAQGQASLHSTPMSSRIPGTVRLTLAGDVMLGRGVDQILPCHCEPTIYESCVKDARGYVALAEHANGPLPPPGRRGFAYPWGAALQVLESLHSDCWVINLETAVTTSDEPWPKSINYRRAKNTVTTRDPSFHL
jgi:hypothetical protein